MQRFVIWLSLYKDHLFGRHNKPTELADYNSQPKKNDFLLKFLVSTICGLIVALAILGFISVKYPFMQVSLLGRNVGGPNSYPQIQKQLQEEVNNYSIKVKDSDTEPTNAYSLEEAGLEANWQATFEVVNEYKNPSNPIKRLAFWEKKKVDLRYSINDKKFNDFIATKMTRIVKAPVNANIVIDNGTITVTPDSTGQILSIDSPREFLLKKTGSLDNYVIVLQIKSMPAKITAKDAEQTKVKLDALVSKPVVFTIASKKITASPNDIASWIDIHQAEEDKTFDFAINSGRILDYLNRISRPYVSPPKNAVILPNSGSRVLIAGKNGMDIVDKEKVASEVAEKVISAKSIERALPVAYQNYKTIQAVPYDKWIAVDLVNKRMYAYEKTELVNTFLVSAGAPATPTVVGSYKIYRKIPSQTMSGPNADGSRYVQPNVQWVNYFYKDYAIHGNYWRPVSYFGNINSSHGCVGVVNDDAAWIYDWAPVGTEVITF